MKKFFTLFAAVVAAMTVNAKVIDLTTIGTAIGEWTVNEATQNSTETKADDGKYVYDIKANVASESFVTAEPDVVFQVKSGSDKAKAFVIYPGKCYEFGGKNGILIIKNTTAGETIKLTAAAKGSTAANFSDESGEYPVNAVAVSTDLVLPAKNKDAEGADAEGYVWKTLEFTSNGGDVEIKEFAGGYRIKSVEIGASEPESQEVVVTLTGADYVDNKTIAKDGVTLTMKSVTQGAWNLEGPGLFTNTLGGNFTKIEVTNESQNVKIYGEGWTGDATKMTWTGKAESVSIDDGDDCGIWGMGDPFTIICTIEKGGSAGIEKVQTDNVSGAKFIKDGKLLIKKNGKLFNVMGTEVK